MKKIMTALLVCLVIGAFATVSQANTIENKNLEDYIQENGEFTSAMYETENSGYFDEVADSIKEFAVKYYRSTGEKIVWTTKSLDSHQKVQVSMIKLKEATPEKIFSGESDFVQVGFFINPNYVEETRAAFEKDPIKAAVNALLLQTDTNIDIDKICKEKQLPVYWKIDHHGGDVYSLEIAIGKYIVQDGDTIYSVAKRYGLSYQKLMDMNQNLINADEIYVGDYLVVFPNILQYQ